MPVSYTHLDVYKRQILESANTFLTDNPNDNYSVSTNSPKKKDALSGVPLTGSPFAGSGVSDFMGLDNDALLSSSSPRCV